ncbi:hypothetical protein PMI41_02128 [Phyllobacterium sp. YR531]|nr:hypothetical protein PMI41_02128 [Phyllobacterium sp. YR531]
MRILSIRALTGTGALARFDLELNEHVRLFGLLLKKFPDGRYRTHAPNSCGKHVASFHPVIASQITDAAVAALSERTAHEHR